MAVYQKQLSNNAVYKIVICAKQRIVGSVKQIKREEYKQLY